MIDITIVYYHIVVFYYIVVIYYIGCQNISNRFSVNSFKTAEY